MHPDAAVDPTPGRPSGTGTTGWIVGAGVLAVGTISWGTARTYHLGGLRQEASAPRDLTTGKVAAREAKQAAGVMLTGSAAEGMVQLREMLIQRDATGQAIDQLDPTVVEGISNVSARIPGTDLPSVPADAASLSCRPGAMAG